MRRLLVFVLGGIAGAGLDQIHVRSGVLSYPAPSAPPPLRQPWWVAPQFGAAFVAIVEAATRVARGRAAGAGPARAGPTGKPATVAGDAAWFLGAYGASGAFRRWPKALAAAMYLSWAGRMLRRRQRGRTALFALALAAGGSGYEHALSGTGAFTYAEPDVGNIPCWLPGLYLHGAPLALDLAARFPRT